MKAVETSLTRALGTPVTLQTKKNGQSGTIRIRYHSLDELDRLIHLLTQES